MCVSPRWIRSSATWSPRRGSTRCRERAVELGWPAGSVVGGRRGHGPVRAATSRGGLGFKELVAEVGLGHVGLVLALEVSRLARSSADWHQLLDLCALTGHVDR